MPRSRSRSIKPYRTVSVQLVRWSSRGRGRGREERDDDESDNNNTKTNFLDGEKFVQVSLSLTTAVQCTAATCTATLIFYNIIIRRC